MQAHPCPHAPLPSCARSAPLRPPQAHQLDKGAALPRLGLAQMCVLMGQAVNAASLLESVLVDAPQWIDALEVLGRVYPMAPQRGSEHKARVVGQFKDAAAARPGNAELWELLGDLLAPLEPAGGWWGLARGGGRSCKGRGRREVVQQLEGAAGGALDGWLAAGAGC